MAALLSVSAIFSVIAIVPAFLQLFRIVVSSLRPLARPEFGV
jgi:hypothetical protein